MKKSIYLILNNIRSMYNIGSIFRTADAFGVEKIYLCGISAYPVKRQMEKISKTALGAEKAVVWEYYSQAGRLAKKLKSRGIRIVSLENNIGDKRLQSLKNFIPKYPLALVVGNEVSGVSKNILQLSDAVIFIPMKGKKESLNVGVAAAIAMYELDIKRSFTPQGG